MSQATAPASSAHGVTWNLGDLYQAADDPRIDQDLATARQRAEAFEKTYRGQISAGPTPAVLRAALRELESLYEQLDKPLIYASLLHAGQTDDPRHGALLARAREERTRINKHLIFFDLEWVQLADAPARQLIDDPALAQFRHYLDQKRAWKPHYLSEPEEKILEEKANTGKAAFIRLFDENVAALRFTYRDATLSLEQVLSKLYDPDRAVRRDGAAALTKGLQDNARLLTYIFNTLVLDHRSDCDLRKFASPMAPRHLANEISDQTVTALINAVEQNAGIVQRYYRLKGKLLGIDQLHDYDRYAPLAADLPTCEWPRARQIVEESYTAFSGQAGGIIREFFDKSWIDAELRPGKRGGAFSSSGVPSVHPYILMNYTDKLRDVMTLAHELGHGLHQYLSRPAGYLQCDTPLTTAETASVFGEMLTFHRLLELHPEPRIKLAMLCSKIEDAFATVFRQIVLTRFEQLAHQARKEKGELTTEQLNEMWLQANRPMHGDVVTLSEGYAWWWLYIGHFIHVPFYCYAYSFGELLVLALVQKHKEEGAAFVPKYLEMLSTGGAVAPPQLLAKLGIDIEDPGFWSLGLKLLDGMVREAEALAETVKL